MGHDGAILAGEIVRGRKAAGKHIINNRNIRGQRNKIRKKKVESLNGMVDMYIELRAAGILTILLADIIPIYHVHHAISVPYIWGSLHPGPFGTHRP